MSLAVSSVRAMSNGRRARNAKQVRRDARRAKKRNGASSADTTLSEWESNKELCDRFFATGSAAPFTDSSHRELLLELFETGAGDPLRWSTARVKQAIGGAPCSEDSIPLEVALDAPDLLRAFIPYAHAQTGIRDELTARTLAMVDVLRSGYKREVLRQAKYWGLDDVV